VFFFDRGANPRGACQRLGFRLGVRRVPGHAVTLRSAAVRPSVHLLIGSEPAARYSTFPLAIRNGGIFSAAR
jgi:hypothetical protein